MLKTATPDLFSASELSIVQGRIESAFREETGVITGLYDTASIQAIYDGRFVEFLSRDRVHTVTFDLVNFSQGPIRQINTIWIDYRYNPIGITT